MKRHQVFPSPYLKAGELNGDEPTLTIKQALTEYLNDGTELRVLTFQETEKKLVLNKTNWSRIEDLTREDDDEKWAGHKIRLTVEKVNFRGDQVPAIRVANADPPF